MEGQRSIVLALMSSRELQNAWDTLKRRLNEAMETGTAYDVTKWKSDLEEIAEELQDRGIDPTVPF